MGIISGIAKPLRRTADDAADVLKRGTVGAGQTVKNNPLKSLVGGAGAWWLTDGLGTGGSNDSNDSNGSDSGWGIFKFGFATLAVVVLGWRLIPRVADAL